MPRDYEHRRHLRALRRYGFTYAVTLTEAERLTEELADELDGELTARRTGLPKLSQPDGPRGAAVRRTRGPLYILRHSDGPAGSRPGAA